METKEVIKYFENYLKAASFFGGDESEQNKMSRGAITLLKRGEKFEKIVKEISETLPKPHYVYKNCRGKEFAYYCNANAIEIIDKIKQKYFPKED